MDVEPLQAGIEVGDTVEFELTNDLPIGTDIHWHGIDVPSEMDGVAPVTQELVESGSTFTYRFTVTEPAIGMYHAHAHGHVAIPNGLFGTFYAGTVGDVAGTTFFVGAMVAVLLAAVCIGCGTRVFRRQNA